MKHMNLCERISIAPVSMYIRGLIVAIQCVSYTSIKTHENYNEH